MAADSSRHELQVESTSEVGCADGCCAPQPAAASAGAAADPPDPRRQAVLSRRIRLLVAATISYNVIEAIVAITAGALASSAALLGFGLDSTIEVASAAAVAWQFSAREVAVRQARERTALRIIAVSFFVLAAYVSVEAVRSLAGGAEAESSTVGIVLAALSVVIMPGLSLAQRRTGRQLGSASAVADSKQTLLCSYLSGVLLVGLVLNAVFGWSWADPIVALVIAAVAVKEGREAWRGDGCCAPTTGLVGDPAEGDGCCGHEDDKR
ncbi:Cation efflux family protein [Actinopolyspora mzabensis]|uniref:Cation efflux family protein n=1 Tax=Actinopolyspora mzabensis TaxID=995066 RepID=A0A1G8Y1T7_ACTMZ|nr:cation transporter [Actinopolyspora mzabensis]SDJ96762.1 Cation efflux family protein [Actinopolyspora mzabensis]